MIFLYLTVSIPFFIMGTLTLLGNNLVASCGWYLAFVYSLVAFSKQKLIDKYLKIIDEKC